MTEIKAPEVSAEVQHLDDDSWNVYVTIDGVTRVAVLYDLSSDPRYEDANYAKDPLVLVYDDNGDPAELDVVNDGTAVSLRRYMEGA